MSRKTSIVVILAVMITAFIVLAVTLQIKRVNDEKTAAYFERRSWCLERLHLSERERLPFPKQKAANDAAFCLETGHLRIDDF